MLKTNRGNTSIKQQPKRNSNTNTNCIIHDNYATKQFYRQVKFVYLAKIRYVSLQTPPHTPSSSCKI